MENLTNTYQNQKHPKLKTLQSQQYCSNQSDPKENSMKQMSSRYSSQMALGHENIKKHSNFQAVQSNAQANQGRLSQKDHSSNSNIQIGKFHLNQFLVGKERENILRQSTEGENQIPLTLYSHIHNNSKIQNELKKLSQQKAQLNIDNQNSSQNNKMTLSQSPKPHSGRQTSNKMNPSYEMLISSQQALEFLNQIENNRNSQPPQPYSSHNSNSGHMQDRKITQGEKKKSSQQTSKQKHSKENVHQKSQSLFNKKIVDIISGLQQSLGVIANNVKHSFNNEELNSIVMSQGNNQALVESALLAQKLAQMTSKIKNQEGNIQNSQKSSSITRQSTDDIHKKQRKHSGNKQKAKGFKTIEEQTSEMMGNQSISNRPSMEGGKQLQGKPIKQAHSRTKSDLQFCRKQTTGGTSQSSASNQVVKTVEIPYQNLASKIASNNILITSQSSIQANENSQGQGGIMKLTHPSLTKSIEDQLVVGQQNKQHQQPQFLQSNINALWQQHPISTKNNKKTKNISNNSNNNNDSNSHNNNRFKQKKSQHSLKGSVQGGGTLSNQRGSISSKQSTKLSCERLSEANAIQKLNKKINNNLLINNLSNNAQYQLEHKLKSAASSPSLHNHHIVSSNGGYLGVATINTKQNINIKKKEKVNNSNKQIFDFGQVQQAHQKLQSKRKGHDQLNQNHHHQNNNNLSSHKRSISDSTSLTKMFHFKQQMMLNKLLSKQGSGVVNSEQVSNHNSMQEQLQIQNQLAKQPPHSSLSQNLVSNISSKRASQENGGANQLGTLSEHNYNSPRQQQIQQINSRVSSSSQRDIYTEMKNFLNRFQKINSNQQQQVNNNQQQILSIVSQQSNQGCKNQPNQIITNQNQDQLASLNTQSYGVTRSTTNTSNQSNMMIYGSVKQNQLNQIKTSQPNQQIQIMTSQDNFELQRKSQQQQQQPSHKRAKSDLNMQLDFLKGGVNKQPIESRKTSKEKLNEQNTKSKNSQQNNSKQRLFILNMKQSQQVRESLHLQQDQPPKLQILSQTPMIYSARASPSSKQIYCNFEDLQQEKKKNQGQQITTNRSDNLTTTKMTNPKQLIFPSNQTTQKKHSLQRECSPSDFETPQFNYAVEGNTLSQQQLMIVGGNQIVPKINNLVYYDMAGGNKQDKSNNNNNSSQNSGDFKQKPEQNRNLLLKSSNFSSNCGDSTESLYYQQQEGLQSQNCNEKRNYVNSSPQLKILPTPKAVQPGGANSIIQQSLILLHTNQTHQSLHSLENIKILSTSQNNSNHIFQSKDSQERVMVSQQQQSKQSFNKVNQIRSQEEAEERLDTYDSVQKEGNNNNLSPRTKEKQRIVKMIKVSFNKLKEPPKTTVDFYRIGKMLGKGAFGRVNLAIHKLTDHLVAVKSINKQFLSEDENSKKKVMQEFLILQKTRQQNIVKLFDSFETNKHIVFVMELCAGGDLLNYVRKRRKLKEDLARYIFKQVVDGLEYCHAKGIVHRDIKLDNLLLDSNGQVKICDFGVSKIIEDHKKEVMTEQCGTPAYIAPEILKDKGYRGFGVDIWSLGVCLYAMLYGTVPFKANNMSELHQLIIKAKYTLKDDKIEISETAKSLIKALLEPDPAKRLTIKQVKQHQWLKELDEECSESLEVFSEEEKRKIIKDFSYQDMKRYQRNNQQEKELTNVNQQKEEQFGDNEQDVGEHITTEHFFTEHALDSTQNALLKNCTTKSLVLAPFNSTRSHIVCEGEDNQNDSAGEPILKPLSIDDNLVFDKKVIKFAARVKDINRQYEMNNNCELDNGVYNKFVRQSTQKENKQEDDEEGKESHHGKLSSDQNSLLSSMENNKKVHKNLKGEGPQAPLVSQNSDDEMEAELIKERKNINQNTELQQMQSFLQTQQSIAQIEDQQLLIDYETVEKVEDLGYPREFILQSLEQYEMNDSTTCYFLLEKERLLHGFTMHQKSLMF